MQCKSTEVLIALSCVATTMSDKETLSSLKLGEERVGSGVRHTNLIVTSLLDVATGNSVGN